MNGMDQRIGPFRAFQFQDKGGVHLGKLLSGWDVNNQKIELGEVVVHIENLYASQSGVGTYLIVVQLDPKEDVVNTEEGFIEEEPEIIAPKKRGRPKKEATFSIEQESGVN